MKQQSNNLYGQTRKSIELEKFVLTETVYPSQAVLPTHSHSDAYFCFVLQGTFQERYENKDRFCRASSVVFHPVGESHSDRFGETEGRCFNLQFKHGWLKHINDYSLILDAPLQFQSGNLAQLFARLYREFRYFDAVSPLVIESISLEIAVAAFRGSKSSDDEKIPAYLKRAKELLHDKFPEQLTLSSIAEQAGGMHPVHLARTFQIYFGCSPGEYIRRLRIEHASRALSASEKSISEIAYEYGFSSQSHFSTTFKRETGLTPAEYRTVFRK